MLDKIEMLRGQLKRERETRESKISNLEIQVEALQKANKKLRDKVKHLLDRKPLLVVRIPSQYSPTQRTAFKNTFVNSDLESDFCFVFLGTSAPEPKFEAFAIRNQDRVDIKQLSKKVSDFIETLSEPVLD